MFFGKVLYFCLRENKMLDSQDQPYLSRNRSDGPELGTRDRPVSERDP
jgi:hypothetical protein